MNLLIATPHLKKPSTAWAYSELRTEEIGRNLDKHELLLQGLKERDLGKIAANMHNDFEQPVGRRFPLTLKIRDTMLEHGALGAILAGSGLSVFGVFVNTVDLRRAQKEISSEEANCLATGTVRNTV
jgi:4-diphosphocytidyl-2-C-methyl-D-erythritol kinase